MLKNGKAAGKNEITGEMIKGGGGRVVDSIWRLINMAFESGVGKLLKYFSSILRGSREGHNRSSRENRQLLRI